MHNFTGSTRRPRNVNLSGKRSSPSSPFGTQKSGLSASLHNVREERAAREEERRRLGAATTLQRTWRGRRVAETQRDLWRELWDAKYTDTVGGWDEFWQLLSVFLGVVDLGRKRTRKAVVEQKDHERLERMVILVSDAIQESSFPDIQRDDRSKFLLRWFAGVLVQAVKKGVLAERGQLDRPLQLLPQLAKGIPRIAGEEYYEALSNLAANGVTRPRPIVHAVLEPLRDATEAGDAAYRALGSRFLTTPDLHASLGQEGVERLRKGIDLGRLSRLNVAALRALPDTEGKLWLLAYVISFGWNSSTGLGGDFIDLTGDDSASQLPAREKYVSFLLQLLAGSALEVGQRINVNDYPMGGDNSDQDEDDYGSKGRGTKKQPLPKFVKDQITSLVKQSSVNMLLSKTKSTTADIKVLASFALTLLVVFPSMKDEVRLWLCLAKTEDGVPAIRYVWDAVRMCNVFSLIKKDTFNAVQVLKYAPPTTPDVQTKEEELNLVFLFLEMYGFLLSVTDDNEFFSGGKGRQLPLNEVQDLTVFLKNIGFAMYWWSGEIMGDDPSKDTSGEVWFKQSDGNGRGWEVKQFRAAVTNVMRAVYARDSRRHFLPKDHWLMTDRLNMEGLIAAAVQEEENREKQMENDSDAEEEEEDDDEGSRFRVDREALAAADRMTRIYLHVERMQRIQRRKQKMNYLASIAPRLEILQNLPFFIPFSTRVQIFRHFVNNDQKKRRKSGRFAFDGGMLEDREMSKHHAIIRRGIEFDDAYKHFWKLGEGLKEPIQITFIDKFGAEEAGIDGGGVTKEFLTGVVGEAFTPSADSFVDDSLDDNILFRANAEHLLYPNPTSIDNLWYRVNQVGVPSSDGEHLAIDLLQRYEFAGRILGKCLYEGILVDVSFAPFFLLKWSQPHSASAVGINDLRDLDADFYRHLMTLKDFDGDVESVFGLDFTVTTEIAPGKTVTRPLKPNGESIPVTNQNRLEYIHLVSRYRLSTEPQRQTTAFLRGLTTLVQPSWLRMFNQSELQTLVGGDTGSPIDIEDLRRHTEYGGTYVIGDDGQEHETIKLFWEVMREFNNEQRGKVLKFVTSVSRAPLLGFGVLKPRFSIRDGGSDQRRLCSASTCVNLLKMPMYRNKKLLREKLLYSVTSNAGFDLS